MDKIEYKTLILTYDTKSSCVNFNATVSHDMTMIRYIKKINTK